MTILWSLNIVLLSLTIYHHIMKETMITPTNSVDNHICGPMSNNSHCLLVIDALNNMKKAHYEQMQSEHIHGFRKFFQLLLILSGDIQVQLGPVKFPCGICARPVASNHRVLQCDRCDYWCHIKCVDIPPSQYNKLIGSAVNWICPPCGTIQFSKHCL